MNKIEQIIQEKFTSKKLDFESLEKTAKGFNKSGEGVEHGPLAIYYFPDSGVLRYEIKVKRKWSPVKRDKAKEVYDKWLKDL